MEPGEEAAKQAEAVVAGAEAEAPKDSAADASPAGDSTSPGTGRRGRERKASARVVEAAKSAAESASEVVAKAEAAAAAKAAKRATPKAEGDGKSPSKKKQKVATTPEDPENPSGPPMKKKFITITLGRLDGSFGIALSGTVVTEVKEGGAAAAEGTIKVGDMILEVNGKDTAISGFASLLPKDKEKSIILKLLRMVTVEAAAAEATEKATAKLQAALDAPDLAEGAEPSAVETRRKMLATAVSVATKAGLDAEAIKPAEAKLAALPPPVEDAGADDKPVLAPAFTHIAKIKPPPSAPAEEEEEAAAVPEAPPPYVVPPYVVPPYVVPGGPEQQAAIFAAQAAASAAAAAAAAAVGFPPP